MRGGTVVGSKTWASAALIALSACAGADSPASQTPNSVTAPPAGGTGAAGASAAGTAAPVGGASGTGASVTGGTGAGAGTGANAGGTGAGAAGASADAGSSAGAGGGGGMGGSPQMPPFTGPIDGDPSKPMVAIDGVPCGVPNVGFGGSPPSVKITNRDVVVAYPCAHEGAAVTFFLFIHGTLQEAQKVAFTMNAFPIHQFVDSHNVIVVTPKAVGTQWGNGDNGVDLPHLYEVVDWVYDTFGTKFNIRAMWASGGSWGSFYLNTTFACDPRFEGRLRGVRMVVGTGCPRCSDRLACIVAEQELEEGMGMPLTPEQQEMKSDSNIGPFAMGHGCDGKMKMPDLGPVRHWTWPNCDAGWAHSYYLGPGQHADPWNDPTAMMHMVEEIKSIE